VKEFDVGLSSHGIESPFRRRRSRCARRRAHRAGAPHRVCSGPSRVDGARGDRRDAVSPHFRQVASPRGAGPLTPDPSPRWGEEDWKSAGLGRCAAGPLTPDPSPRWGEGDWKTAGLGPSFPSRRRGEGAPLGFARGGPRVADPPLAGRVRGRLQPLFPPAVIGPRSERLVTGPVRIAAFPPPDHRVIRPKVLHRVQAPVGRAMIIVVGTRRRPVGKNVHPTTAQAAANRQTRLGSPRWVGTMVRHGRSGRFRPAPSSGYRSRPRAPA
jgi:hypothetical protein